MEKESIPFFLPSLHDLPLELFEFSYNIVDKSIIKAISSIFQVKGKLETLILSSFAPMEEETLIPCIESLVSVHNVSCLKELCLSDCVLSRKKVDILIKKNREYDPRSKTSLSRTQTGGFFP